MAAAPERLVAAISEVAERAGKRILELYRAGVAVEHKADDSPVTAADRAAEAIILPVLRALTPEIPIVAEEAVAVGDCPSVGERFWLVDALDGTKEFVRRLGEFTVNIALIEAAVPILGVVHIPVSGETYAGGGGWATRRREGENPRPIAARHPAADGIELLTSRSHGDPAKLDAVLQSRMIARGGGIKSRRAVGSSIKFCLIAAGEADLYVRLAPTMEWDTAAGHAVLAGAGGAVETLEGAPLAYGKAEFRNPGFIARGRSTL